MCYFLNTFYTCNPTPRPARTPNHFFRTSLLCSASSPCPLSLWETRTVAYPFPCPNCTGETTAFSAPFSDIWNHHHDDIHDEAVTRYLIHLLHLLNAFLLSSIPSSTAFDFLSAYPTLRSETLCRQHGEHPTICACPSVGPRSWIYNLATSLRASASSHALQAFLSNHAVTAAIAGPLHDEVTSTVEALAARCEEQDFAEEVSMIAECEPPEAHIHENLDPRRPLSEGTVFSEEESGRRLDYAISAQEVALAAMMERLAPLPWHVGKTAEAGMLFRLQIARTFSLFPIMDSGLSPLRADMVSERLATLILDPVLVPDCPLNLTDTRYLIAALIPHFYPTSSEPLPNPIIPLYDDLTRSVEDARARHTHELCFSMHAHLSFRNAIWPFEVDKFLTEIKGGLHAETQPKNAENREEMAKERRARVAEGIPPPPKAKADILACPLVGQNRCRRPVKIKARAAPQDADPQDWHTPRVMVPHCGHVLGRRCAFVAGVEAAEGSPHAWTCPVCPGEDEDEHRAWKRKKNKQPGEKRIMKQRYRHGGPERIVDETIMFKWPMTAAMNGKLEKAVMAQVQGETFPGTVRRGREKKKAKKAKARTETQAKTQSEAEGYLTS